ncbi:MAG: phosphoadenosine phosphosulfate reductase family protein, partial [Myxococcales bacterium]|nr:phosphoadenosine phosphosulfate reductase family protein [Myxococcales bacterium]
MQRRILASVSGGKDSGAMALWLLEQGLEIEAVFLDTGWEHPATYDYLRSTLAGAIGEITWLRPERSMSELVLHKSMFPSRARRFCTADLKLAPFEAHIASYPPGTVVNVIGVRADESRARAGLPRWSCEDGNRVFVDTWRPLIAWREDDVFAIHARHGLSLNPLYAHGAARVGCWPCIYARRAEIRRLAEIDPGRIEHIRQLERDVGSTFFYDRGGRGATCIDEVVAWARAGAGAGDESDERFDPGEGNRGCMRWGLCDLATPEAPDHDERVQAQRARAPHAGGAPPAGDDALAWAARGYRLQLEGHA